MASSAQSHKWTLDDCISYAIAHNISVKQKDNTRLQQEITLSTSRNSRLPDLNAGASQNFSFGRGLTSENTYTNTNTSSTQFSLSTSVNLFDGMKTQNTIAINRLNLEAATADLEKAKNDISLNVAAAYVQILYKMEILDVARRQISIDSMQVARLDAMYREGKASEAELAQQQATLAQSRSTATQADNDYQLALLDLSQLLELPSPEGLDIALPQREGRKLPYAADTLPLGEGWQEASFLAIRPEIQAENLRLQTAEKNIKIAQSALYPQLSLSAGLGSNYYKTSGYKGESFAKQLENNFSQYIGLSLSIPIFNRFATRNNIRSARIDRDNQQLQLDNAKKTLYKEVQQAYHNALAAQSKYESCQEATKSSDAAFRLAKAKYENGKATITEFNESKNNALKAESDLAQAKYENMYYQAVIAFYRGDELRF